MTGFTKGPWGASSIGFVRTGAYGEGYSVASVYGEFGNLSPDDVTDANTNLIAAAPDLYEALEWLETYAMIQVDRHPDAEDNKGWRRIIAALEKARGVK